MAEKIEKPDELTETEALMKILELGKRQVAEGKARPAEEVFERLRKKHGFLGAPHGKADKHRA